MVSEAAFKREEAFPCSGYLALSVAQVASLFTRIPMAYSSNVLRGKTFVPETFAGSVLMLLPALPVMVAVRGSEWLL